MLKEKNITSDKSEQENRAELTYYYYVAAICLNNAPMIITRGTVNTASDDFPIKATEEMLVEYYKNRNVTRKDIVITFYKQITELNDKAYHYKQDLRGGNYKEFRPDARQVEISNPVKTTSYVKTFDKVLVRDDDTHEWKINIFSHYDSSRTKKHFVCIDRCFKQCIPYDEYTAHLLGTTNAYEEGGEK